MSISRRKKTSAVRQKKKISVVRRQKKAPVVRRKKKAPVVRRKKKTRAVRKKRGGCPLCHLPLTFRYERRFMAEDDTSDLTEGQMAEYMAAEMGGDSDNFHETVKVGCCSVHGVVLEEGEGWTSGVAYK
jgi:hypothetical protein